MIFTRALVSALVAAALVPGLGAGAPDPGTEIAARRLIVERAGVAAAALADLEAGLARPLDEAREGVARAAAGGEPPGEPLGAARAALVALEPVAARARDAVVALDAARRAADPTAPAIAVFMEEGELARIAAELTALGPSADEFAANRVRAELLPTLLDETLAAIEDGDLERAGDALAAARADHDRLREWRIGLDALSVWLDTTGRLVDATERLVEAFAAGDRSAAESAADRIAAIEPEATSADRALRIAMSEGAGTLAGGAPAALADLDRRVMDARATVESILQTVAR